MKDQRKNERNDKIRADVKKYIEMGFKTKESFKLVAEKWFLSSVTIEQIWYCKGYYNPIFATENTEDE